MKRLKKGFTLIELLVVITIIGILATGGVAVYTSQIQKARDTTRVGDIKALQGAVEQYYGDTGGYPSRGTGLSGVASSGGILPYISLPSDPKAGNSGVSSFDYLYNVSPDGNSIPAQEYELSVAFEQSANITGKAALDGGNDNVRLEMGINLTDTEHLTSSIGGILPTVTAGRCVTSSGAVTTCGTAAPTVIRKQ